MPLCIIYVSELLFSYGIHNVHTVLVHTTSNMYSMRLCWEVKLNDTVECSYQSLSSNLQQLSPPIKKLLLPYNSIARVKHSDLVKLVNLEIIDLTHNNLTHFAADTFEGLNHLTEVNVALNPIDISCAAFCFISLYSFVQQQKSLKTGKVN